MRGSLVEIPRREIRAITWSLWSDIARLMHRTYMPDVPFVESIELTCIVNTLFDAQLSDKPLTTSGLAQYLQIPRATLFRRLAKLE
jgi:hypothetical protein